MSLKCPQCGGTEINQNRCPTGAIWCMKDGCGLKADHKERWNPFVTEERHERVEITEGKVKKGGVNVGPPSTPRPPPPSGDGGSQWPPPPQPPGTCEPKSVGDIGAFPGPGGMTYRQWLVGQRLAGGMNYRQVLDAVDTVIRKLDAERRSL